jgi:acetylornithine deacetylase/succinyl-diaminopimelate desuccinylase-like protein
LCEEHGDAVRCDYLINEGSGDRVELGGNAYYLCSVSEKMSAPFRLRVRGRSGHASMPGIADNALVKAAPHIAALGAYRPTAQLIPEVERFFEVTLGSVPAAQEALRRAHELGARAVEIIEPLLSLTLSPTMIEASQARNVIPAVCDVTVDCRLLPGQLPEHVEPVLREVIGAGDWDLDWIESTGGTRSAIDTPLWSAFDDFVARIEPGARLVPSCNAGFTDSHYLRESFGTTAYGFFPMRTMTYEVASRLEHSADERVPVDDLELGLDALRHAAHAVL